MKRTVVKTTFPYPLIWDRGNLDIRIDDKVFEVYFERKYRQETDPRVSGSGFIEVQNDEWPFDRLGRFAHTELEIRFPMYVEYDIESPDAVRQWTHTIINRLLDVYRSATEEFYVDHIPRNELRDYTVRTLKDDGTFENTETIAVFMPEGPLRKKWRNRPRTLAISPEARQMLRDGTEPPIPKVLYLNARREELFENYRIAVVEAETAFEALIDQVIALYYRRQGHSTAEIENKLRAGLTSLIAHHIPRCCGVAFESTSEHTAWQTDLYELRNSVVHDGASVNANQARRAIVAAARAMKWIEARASV